MNIEKVILPLAMLVPGSCVLAQDAGNEGLKQKEVQRLSREDILKKVCSITSGLLGISPDGITGKMDFTNDMGGDSLDMVEMIMACEKEFGISIPDEKAEKVRTVNQAADMVYSLLQEGTQDGNSSHTVYDCVGNFSEGLARVKLNGKWFSIDKTGKCVKDCP